MSAPALQVQRLSKQYTVGARTGPVTLYETLSSWLRPDARERGPQETFWALRGVDFEVAPGEVVGIVGRNGAGKSTLLKILSRITAPTEGRVTVRGRMASLLEVGTGFHPELTGRENIYLNGAILGMRRADIDRQFDAIVAFAEVERFVDTPVKRYSSGMYVRLAFSVAAHLDPDVLLIDEVLAVGDAAFQKRCLGKMHDVASAGRTVIFVSHNLAAVRDLCDRTLLLESGGLRFDGPTREALTLYESEYASAGGKLAASGFSGELASVLSFREIRLLQDGSPVALVDPMREFVVQVHGTAARTIPSLDVNIVIGRDSFHFGGCFDSREPAAMRAGDFVSSFIFPGDLLRPGRYTISIGASTATEWVWGPDVAVLDFSENQGGRPEHRVRDAVQLPYQAERQQ